MTINFDMKHILILIFLLWFCTLNGQEQEDDNWEEVTEGEVSRVHFVEANFSMYAPLDAYSEKIDRSLLYGFSLGYLRQLQLEKPSFIGIEAFHMNLGIYSQNYDAVISNEQIVVTGKVASNALGINLIYRYYPPLKLSVVEPYVEGQFGAKWMYSYLSESGVFSDEEQYDSFDFLTGTWVLTYGGAFGLQIHISDIYFLNLKSSYHFAVSGEYEKRLEEDSGFFEFPQEAFETVQSSTNVVKIDVGMTFLF